MPLNNFDNQAFLNRYWQREPLLIRGALPDIDCPVDGNDLAGLACEEMVESRLVMQQDDSWLLRHGPFTEEDFAQLPRSHWTLLVQAVDQWIPEVAALLQHFDFLPRWRIDDIMISYAVDGGGVGPHFDHYDVFLLQGRGQRQWQLGQHCDDRTPLHGDSELRLLPEFESRESHLLQAGDILYIPPGVAHRGDAVGDDCITLSVGLRAPSVTELLGRWLEQREDELGEADRYCDPDYGQHHPAEIPRAAFDEVRRLLRQQFDTRRAPDWFGELMTEPRYPELIAPSRNWTVSALREALRRGQCVLNGASRLAFFDGDPLLLFADGRRHPCPTEWRGWVAEFCELLPGAALPSSLAEQQDAKLELLCTLARQGTLVEQDADS